MGPIVHEAQGPLSPLVLDSPHSGSDYPPDFDHVCERDLLRRAEDHLVDRLYGFAPALGVPLICAPFPRSYLDVNRAPEDIDPALLAPHEREGLVPTAKSALGVGLVWRLLDGREPIYGRPLTRAELASRIERCWVPYHRAVAGAIDAAHARHGVSVHINCHSMPARSSLYPSALAHTMPYDFLVGDRDGSTASAALTRRVAELLRADGHRVGINEVFKGVELVRRHAAPELGRHSIQIEINKRLYMDEERHAAHDGYARVQALLDRMVRALLAPGGLPVSG